MSHELLDPAASSPDAVGHVELWLRVQAALHLEPESVPGLIARAGGDPQLMLAAIAPQRVPVPDLPRWRGLLADAGVRLVPIVSSLYPESLRAIADPPVLLGVEGTVECLSAGGVAIVGARAATRYGLDVAQSLAAALARRGVVVVSGMARGVDAAAHRGALEAGGRTVAVLACGLEQTYPPEHRALRRQIAETGAVLSEMPPEVPPRAPYFPLRNRLISGIADVVVVVEARERSGSLVTARHALAQGREVLAVPGPIGVPTSAGPNRLLAEGAAPMLSVDDVLGRLPAGRVRDAAPASPRATDRALAPDAAELIGLLARGPLDRDAACSALEWSASRLAVALVSLTLAGRVVEDRDGRLHPRDVHS